MNLDMFVNGVEIYKFKTKDSEMNVVICLSNVWKDFSVDNMKNIALYGWVFGWL